MDWVAKYWIEAIFGLVLTGFGVAFKFAYKKILEQLKGQRNVQNGLVAILHDLIYKNCSEYLSRGSVTTDELENLSQMYETYHSLGGNGTATALYQRCCALTIKQEVEK